MYSPKDDWQIRKHIIMIVWHTKLSLYPSTQLQPFPWKEENLNNKKKKQMKRKSDSIFLNYLFLFLFFFVLLRSFRNYWMRLSRIWRILQIKEGAIHRGRRPSWITPSVICRIIHILRKPSSINALLFIQNISPFLNEIHHCALCFSISSPGFLGQRFNKLQRAALLTSFWRHRLSNLQQTALLTSLVQYDKDSFQIWSTAAGYGELCVWF